MASRRSAASRTILVMANRCDSVAREFAGRYRSRGVRLITPDHLSQPGWCYAIQDIERSKAMVGGRPILSKKIGGVLTRLAQVSEDDLPHIVPDDRSYVAAEMSAFLLAWLSALPCPILNRPTPVCLSGVWYRHEQWVHLAFRLGIPVAPLTQRVMFSTQPNRVAPRVKSLDVTLLGQKVLGCKNAGLAARAQALAGAAGVDFLTVRFSAARSGPAFLDVNAWPDIARDDIAPAVLDYFDAKHHQGEA